MSLADIKISVVVPLFENGGTIEEALASIRSQSPSPSEVVVVDDGSHDDSAAQAVKAGQFVPGFKLIREMHLGVSAARNRGVAASTMPWVAFLDADDVWRKDHIKELMAVIAEFPETVIAGTAFREVKKVDECPDVDDRAIHRSKINYFGAVAKGRAPFFTSTVMVKRSAFNRVGGFPLNVSRGEDLVVWSLIAADGPVAISSYVGGYYRRGSSTLTRSLAEPPNKAIETYRAIAMRPDTDHKTAEDAHEAANWVALTLATEAIMAERKSIASSFLYEASRTRLHVNRWRLLKTTNLLPGSLGTWILNFVSLLRATLRRST